MIDSRKAWFRLAIALALSTIGGVGMWSIVVVLPAIQAEFAISRADAAVAYTATMLGFACGGVVMGRLVDRAGIMPAVMLGSVMLGIGYGVAALAPSFYLVVAAQGLLIGALGCSPTFGPMVADVSMWFARRRGVAVSICASGNYLAGTIWPPVLGYLMEHYGWRTAYGVVGVICLATMLPLAWLMRARPPVQPVYAGGAAGSRGRIPLPPALLQGLLVVAGLACCVAMSMPQVHIVAYCGDLGYGVARGTEMLSLMLGCGISSRVTSGFIADRIGGLPTVILGSALQGVALLLYLNFNGLSSLYVISALFGLFQGGIVPSYAVIVREYFPAKGAATRISLVLMSTVVGMALGGWLSGVVFDLTGTYAWAFIHGLGWNALNLTISITLLALAGRAGWGRIREAAESR